jgi:hypothetical protein
MELQHKTLPVDEVYILIKQIQNLKNVTVLSNHKRYYFIERKIK